MNSLRVTESFAISTSGISGVECLVYHSRAAGSSEGEKVLKGINKLTIQDWCPVCTECPE
jgi:hypothetical protein